MMAQKITSLATAAVVNNFSDEKYVHVSDPGVEPEVPNEQELQKEIQEIIQKVQSHNFSLHRHGFRATHVKTQAIAKGTFTVAENLPPGLAVGICSPENARKSHPCGIRFANEPSFLQDDRAPGPRGCGLKVFDVEGDFMTDVGKSTKTQDFTFNNAPVLELRDVKTTVEIFQIREKHFFEPEKIPLELKKRSDASLQLAPTQLPNQHFLSYTMYSQSAYRWGDHVVKYGLFPSTKLQNDLSSQKINDSCEPDQHSKWLTEYFKVNDAEYDFKIQLCQSLKAQSVEDTSVEWDETAFPFVTVAHIKFPMGQDTFDASRRKIWDDQMALNVWDGLSLHRPLGSVNRLRKELYQVSRSQREKWNATETKKIKSLDELP